MSKLKKFFIFILISLIAFSIFMLILGMNLSKEVKEKFSHEYLSKMPATIYGRVITLQPGFTIPKNELVDELKLLQYVSVNKVDSSGEFKLNGNTLDLMRRPFTFQDGKEGIRHVKINFDGNTISRITDAETGENIGFFRLDPKFLGMLNADTKQQRIYYSLRSLPDILKKGLVATEDKNFYEHGGVSFRSIARAFVANILAGRTVQGGSTLTQQLAKNLFLSRERTLWRKFQEAYIAIIISSSYSKDKVLQGYLNQVYLGQYKSTGIYGFGLAAQFYFGRPLTEIRADQMALLIGLVKGPSYYNPWSHPKRALERRNIVLKLMSENGVITNQQYSESVKMPLDITPEPVLNARQPAYFEEIQNEIKANMGEEFQNNIGLRVFTTLDPYSQVEAEKAIRQEIPKLEKSQNGKKLEAAFVSVDRLTGEIRAMIGSSNPGFPGFNRALDMRRSIGSLTKPAIYLTALELPKQYNLSTPLANEPINIKLKNGKTWSPRNDDLTNSASVPLFLALAQSKNIPTVNLGMALGLDKVKNTLTVLGIPEQQVLEVPSMLLGTYRLSPLEVTQMFQAITNRGRKAKVTALSAIVDQSGKILYQYWPKSQQVVSPQAAWLTTWDMQQVVKRGTARYLEQKFPNMGIAGKTGTSSNNRDSWFVGVDGREVSAVWVGRDDNKTTSLFGSTGGLKIYAEYLSNRKPVKLHLPLPENIIKVKFSNQGPNGSLIQDCNGSLELPIWNQDNSFNIIDCSRKKQAPTEQRKNFFERLFDW